MPAIKYEAALAQVQLIDVEADAVASGIERNRAPNAPAASKVNWRRVFGVSSLVFALLLISGSIYLHVRQKHRLGRLSHERRPVSSVGVDATPLAQERLTNDDERLDNAYRDYNEYSDDSLFTAVNRNSKDCGDLATASNVFNSSTATSSAESSLSSSSASVESTSSAESIPNQLPAHYVTEACLQCICETTSGCEPTTCGPSADCGVFRISEPYWLDAGKPQLQGDVSKNNSDKGYSHCVNNVHCAGRAVTAYVNRYRRDCNQDGVIECRDHIALHLLGPNGCMESELMPLYEMRMESCLANFE